jgi:rare lipoprotein A
VKSLLVLPLVAIALCAGCSASRQPPKEPVEQGVASWYGERHHGRLTASGQIFDMWKRTAAHRTLPFGTELRVHDLATKRTVDVVVNDRGPFVKQRIIDLARAAANDIGIIERGTTVVELSILRRPGTRSAAVYAVQVGMTGDREAAESLRKDMESRFGTARLVRYDAEPVLWRILVGQEESIPAAEALSQRVGQPEALVVLFDPE